MALKIIINKSEDIKDRVIIPHIKPSLRLILNKQKKPKKSKSKKRHSNQPLTVDDWSNRLNEHLNSLSKEQRRNVISYLPCIMKGIGFATQYDGLDEFEGFSNRKESYAYELLIQGADYILKHEPPEGKVVYWAKKLCSNRKHTWNDSKIRQRENIQLMEKPLKVELNEESKIVDYWFPETEWQPLINPPDPFKHNPEGYMIAVEEYLNIVSLPDKVGSMKRRKHAKLYQKIIGMQFDGFEVLPKHGELFDIPEENVATFKNQMLKCAREVIARGDEEIVKNQQIYKDQKGKKWKIKKSTFPERKAHFRDPHYDAPRLIWDWKVIKGNGVQVEVGPASEAGIHRSEALNDIAA